MTWDAGIMDAGFSRLRALRWLRRRGDACGLHSPSEFRHILGRERERTDRGGPPFSVVVLTRSGSLYGCRRAKSFMKFLRDRLRRIDEPGWIDHQTLGVILPITSTDGAEKVATDLSRGAKRFGVELSISVHQYPADLPQRPRSSASDTETYSGAGQPLASLLCQEAPLWKRSFDLVGASVAIVALLPLLACIAAAVRFTSPGPLIFKQL